MPKIYLDVFLLELPLRPYTQARIHLEAEAVLAVIAECETVDWEWISSEVIELEISHVPNAERRRRVQMLASHSHRSVVVEQTEMERAQESEGWDNRTRITHRSLLASHRADQTDASRGSRLRLTWVRRRKREPDTLSHRL